MPLGYKYDIGRTSPPRWDDISVPATQTKRGSNDLPDFDFTNIGLLFPQNKTDERVYMVFQMSHKKKLGTGIYLHVHFIQSSAAVPVFRAETRFYNNGAAVTSYANSDTGATLAFPYTSGSILQILSFPLLAAPTAEGLSANMDVIFYRTDNVVTGDVLVKYIDAHYQIDTDGSREEMVK